MTFALEKRCQSLGLGYASAIQGNPRVAESVCEQPTWHHPRNQLQSQELKPAFLRMAQVLADICRCVGVSSSWESKTGGLQMGEEPGLAIAPMSCWLEAKQHPSWLSNPRQLLCEKGKEAGKKGELPF